MVRVKLAAAAACMLVGAAANATPGPITSIRINNAEPSWLQVSEVIAIQTGTGTDVALASQGATATASSNYGGSDSPAYAIDGVGPSSYPYIYHSAGADGSDWLLITLASGFNLSSLTIQGRTDCCANRDLYNYQLFNGTSMVGSGLLDARNGAHSATVTFAAPAAPEPASWAMMLSGFGLIGGAMRSRRRSAVSFG
jgi:hypothetical protein